MIECTGIGQVIISAARRTGPGAVIALTGLAHDDLTMDMQPAAINKNMVYGNKVIFGSVNAARRHYEQAAMPWPKPTAAGLRNSSRDV